MTAAAAMRQTSLSTRFCITLIAIVAVLMTGFAIVATLFTVDRISDQLDEKIASYLSISAVGLEAPLWNLDNRVVAGYLDSLMRDPSTVYSSILSVRI